MEVGESEIIYLSVHCYHQKDSCIKKGSDKSHFNVTLIVRDKVTRQCPQTTTFEEKGEPKQIRTKVLLLTSLTPYRQAKQVHTLPGGSREDLQGQSGACCGSQLVPTSCRMCVQLYIGLNNVVDPLCTQAVTKSTKAAVNRGVRFKGGDRPTEKSETEKQPLQTSCSLLKAGAFSFGVIPGELLYV